MQPEPMQGDIVPFKNLFPDAMALYWGGRPWVVSETATTARANGHHLPFASSSV